MTSRTDVILSFDVDAESAILASGRRYAEHAMVMTHQAFGPRVGVPRILGLLAEYRLPATFFVPGLTAERYPGTVSAILEAGHEVAHHSWSHRSAVDMSADEERADFERALAVLRRLGVEVLGLRSALWEATWRTPGLVAEHGLAVRLDLMDGDSPYILQTGNGRDRRAASVLGPRRLGAVCVPAAPRHRLDDQVADAVAELWIHELDAMRRHGCLFVLTCHPFLSGRAGRVEALSDADRGGVGARRRGLSQRPRGRTGRPRRRGDAATAARADRHRLDRLPGVVRR